MATQKQSNYGHLSPTHIRTVLIFIFRIITLVMVSLKCMSNLPLQLVFSIFYTSFKASTCLVV